MTAVRTVAVLGAGIMGTSTALYLARRGLRVVLFDEADAPFTGASRWNEGKIHLGYLYSAAPSLSTARLILPGGLAFKRLVEELVGRSIGPATADADDIYLLHRDSVVAPDLSRAYFESIATMVREHPHAKDYLTDGRASSVVPLKAAELATVANPDLIVAGYRIPERSVSTRWIADAFVSAVEAEPRVTLAMRERIVDVSSTDPRGDGAWRVQSTTGSHGPFDAVVNALWHGRPAIDRRVADCVDALQHYRYRVALFVRSTRPLPVPSLLVAVGPYGDIKNYNGRDFYLSWYPVGRLVEQQGIEPPVTPTLDQADRHDIGERMFEALSAILPDVPTIRAHLQELVVQGGWVYAQAQGSLDDPRSSLHHRDQLGVKWFGRYASVDTGKYSVAPYLARAIADRLADGSPVQR
jgi:glycine/D-amino acid oxidase-like deaminating enzyme